MDLTKLFRKERERQRPEVFMFVDPATHSTGYAIFSPQGELLRSGTIHAYGTSDASRLAQVASGYALLCRNYAPSTVVVERMNRQVHHLVIESVGAIKAGICIASKTPPRFIYQSPNEWKAYLKRQGLDLDSAQAKLGAKTGDEAVALSMGYRHFGQLIPQGGAKHEAA